ncbi:hypothetical protein PENARI_c001G10343 [Penicillium arizonense]|uniref:Transcription factor domain-containing protein n=1 Tax=Penicillium arizonense TaxID=1835702 RepID=A0A1F5LYM0_PENAI|nr:hypothetical protein PENARI_c001G10343 [Penicillium arizonense]OGE58089.1 hypothetical protein PENARI_c001G10343 [Penicillium arizonense]
MSCEYPGQNPESSERDASKALCMASSSQTTIAQSQAPATVATSQNDDILNRIRKLEETVYERSNASRELNRGISTTLRSPANTTSMPALFTPFALHHQSTPDDQPDSTKEQADTTEAIKQLPPIGQARHMFDHFVKTLQPTFGILHIPSTRSIMEKTYQGMLDGEQPTSTNLMLLFSIFSGAALVWSPYLLRQLNATQDEARAAFNTYSLLATSILEHPLEPVQPSTTAIVAIATLGHLLANTVGFSIKIGLLQTRCFLMAQALQIHRLDTVQAQEERRVKGLMILDIGLMADSRRLASFFGRSHEGTYIFQPRHMKVNYPSNIDDELLTATGIQQDLPSSVPTAMSGPIQRIRLATLCREVVDAVPSILLDDQEPEYEVILALDKKFHECFENMPDFYRMNPESIQRSQDICKERPYITWQRINFHFSIHTRLCRLHRRYHLEGVTNPKYAYSHRACIRSAQAVLELRRAMDDIDPEAGGYPARFWRVNQHVFLAALILATDVSFHPNAPDAEARKAKVLAAYKTLEKSKQESGSLVEGVQRNMQTLMSTLQKQQPRLSTSQPRYLTGIKEPSVAARETGLNNTLTGGPGELSMANEGDQSLQMQSGCTPSGGLTDDIGEEGWQQLWSDFVAVAPDLDVPQWNSLLDDIDFGSGWLDGSV